MMIRWPRRFGGMFRDMERLRNEFDRLLAGPSRAFGSPYPAVNVWHGKDKVVVTAELPGLKTEELEISVVGNTLTVHGTPTPEEERDYHRRERLNVEFHRTIDLPYEVDQDKVEAKLDKGILAIALPRAEADKPRRITVKAG